MKLLVTLVFTMFLAGGVFAQKESVTAEADFTGGPPPTVVKLPLPAYPKEAKKANLGGRVSVAVTIDDQGAIQTVDDAEGPYPVCQTVTDPNVLALRLAATNAAKKVGFKPALRDQVPIWVKGRIAYSFNGYPKPGKSQMESARGGWE